MIATPAYDPMVWAETYASVASLDKCGMEVACCTPSGHGVVKGRTLSVEAALDSGADWLLFVDSDVVVPRDGLANLLSHGEDVCFGYYTKGSGSSGETCLCKCGSQDYDDFASRQELHSLRDGGVNAVEVKGGGLGCALIRVDVFRRVKEPWFAYRWSRKGPNLSEDYRFCSKCREAGYRLIADTRVDCGHMRPSMT